MASYVYDEFRVTLTARAAGGYDAVGVGGDGVEHRGVFRLPFEGRELERRVLDVAQHTVARSVTRDIGGDEAPAMDAEVLGGALAAALLLGDVAVGYDTARQAAVANGRGLRLTLSLGAAPALLGVPWELLYRPPTFLANQRQTPVVRHLDVSGLPEPPAIEGTVRILGVIANPADTAPLDVAAERSRVEGAIGEVVAAGLVTLDWLEPATPRRLREVLRDGTYHVLHYVGHGDFTPDGEGVLFLEPGLDHPGEQHTELDSNELASLLADQASLRLVVLNACEGARTSLTDPFAGVATTLVQLGVPAVVAMQFAISDAAAILFAEELYTNLIGRRSSIDAAVSEARKAIFIEQGTVEWATPVLFMGDTEVELWRWRSQEPAPPMPPAPPAPPARPRPAPVPDVRPSPGETRRWRGRTLAAALVVLVVAIGWLWWSNRADPDERGAVDVNSATGPAATSAVESAATAPDGSVPPAEPVSFAGTVSGLDEVTHPLDLVAGQLIYVHEGSECNPNSIASYRLVAPSGAQHGGSPIVCSDLGRVDVTETGTWSLVVSGSTGSGRYRIEVTPVPADTVTPLEAGVPVVGEIAAPGERRLFRFSAASGDLVYVVSSRTGQICTGAAHQIVTAAGDEVSGEPFVCSDIGRTALPTTGEYDLVVASWEGGVGSYTDTLVRVPPDEVAAVTVPGTVTGEIAVPGAAVRYTFDAAAGDLLALDGRGPDTTGVAYLVEGPGGAIVSSNPFAMSDTTVTLPATGTYALVVASYSGGVGAYTIDIRPGP